MPIPDADVLRRALDLYPAVVERQGVARLPDLDRWYRDELPELIGGRGPARVTHAELIRITEWKMARGVWRAPNLALVRGNDPDLVEETSRAALSAIPDPAAPIRELSSLKGVGAATASAVASAAAPDIYPFFDELVAAQLPGLGETRWTLSYYKRYAETLREAAGELGEGWTPTLLERALWSRTGGKAGHSAG